MTVRTEILEKADFGGIRYAQCWEDADVLLEAMQVQGQTPAFQLLRLVTTRSRWLV